MTNSDIKKYYRIIGYINLILSVLYLLISREKELLERIFIVIAINIGYHMMYLFFAGIYNALTRIRKNNSFNKNIGGIMLGLFAMFGMLGSFFLIYVFISSAISLNEYYRLFAICIPFGLFLGSYSMWTDLKKE